MVPCGAGASDIRGDPVCQRAERPERDPGSLADASGHPDRPGHRDRVSIHGRVASRAPAPGSPRCGGCPMTTSPELLEHAAAAVAWLRESGWTTRKHDVEIAVEVYMRPTRSRPCLATALEHALGRKGSREDLNHKSEEHTCELQSH